MEHMSNIFSTSFGINFAKLTRVWLALISLTAEINSLIFLSHPVHVYCLNHCLATCKWLWTLGCLINWIESNWMENVHFYNALNCHCVVMQFYRCSQHSLQFYVHSRHNQTISELQHGSATGSRTAWIWMLRAIDGSAPSIDRAAQSSDPSFTQPSVDRTTIDGSRCAIDR